MLYQYFTRTVNTFTSEESVKLYVTAKVTGPSDAVIFYSVQNTGAAPVNVTKIVVQGGSQPPEIQVGKLLAPGAKLTGMQSVSNFTVSAKVYAYVEYVVGNQTMVSEPVSVIVS